MADIYLSTVLTIKWHVYQASQLTISALFSQCMTLNSIAEVMCSTSNPLPSA